MCECVEDEGGGGVRNYHVALQGKLTHSFHFGH